MALQCPIVLVEDDPNDVDIITAALKELRCENNVRSFADAADALDYLRTTTDKPFIILCDIHMPRINGLAFRKSICDDDFLRRKSIPFLFLTSAVSTGIINEAYDLHVQGFYEKAKSYTALKEQLTAILEYWTRCLHPNKNE